MRRPGHPPDDETLIYEIVSRLTVNTKATVYKILDTTLTLIYIYTHV